MVEVPTIDEELQSVADSIGLLAVGFTSADPFEDARAAITERSELGYFGSMKFAMANPDRSCCPSATMTDAKTIVSAALGYWREGTRKPDSNYARVARYAWRDHYGELRSKLEMLACVLKAHDFRAMVLTDSNALVDRAPAVRASLGFFGKHSNVITPAAGSWVVIGSILTDANLPATQTHLGSCGSCTLCLKSCPTGAIVSPGVVDSRRCIAYLLQAPGLVPLEFRRQVGVRIYGCDDCQECCPINMRSVEKGTCGPNLPTSGDVEWASISEILRTPATTLAERFQRFYMPRNDYEYLHRNALIALGNSADSSHIELAMEFLEHRRPMLRATAAWAMGEVGSPECTSRLRDRYAAETDDVTRGEIALALDACGS